MLKKLSFVTVVVLATASTSRAQWDLIDLDLGSGQDGGIAGSVMDEKFMGTAALTEVISANHTTLEANVGNQTGQFADDFFTNNPPDPRPELLPDEYTVRWRMALDLDGGTTGVPTEGGGETRQLLSTSAYRFEWRDDGFDFESSGDEVHDDPADFPGTETIADFHTYHLQVSTTTVTLFFDDDSTPIYTGAPTAFQLDTGGHEMFIFQLGNDSMDLDFVQLGTGILTLAANRNQTQPISPGSPARETGTRLGIGIRD